MNKPMTLLLALPWLCATAWADPALNVTNAGRPAAASLKVKSSLVPTFDVYQKKVVKGKVEIYKVKSIPVLDLGEERQVQLQLRVGATRGGVHGIAPYGSQ